MEIGSKIREVRKQKGLTLKDVARVTGVTVSLLSQIENGKVQPSLSSLWAISKALATPVAFFFGQDTTEPMSPVVRASEPRVVKTQNGLTYNLLSQKVAESNVELLRIEFEKGATTDGLHQHDGFECGLVLEGKLEVVTDTDRHILNKGDSITLDSTAPHDMRNIAEGVTTVIWTNTHPTL